jgi:peroxiredoxin
VIGVRPDGGAASLGRGPRRLLPLAAAALLLGAACERDGREPAAPPAPVGIEEGNTAPPLAGRLADGGEFALDPHPGREAVLVFYRGGYCGLCRVRLAQLQENLGAYDGVGAQVVAVTPEGPEAGAALAEQLQLSFPVVSADPEVLRQWGVVDADHDLPRPATFVVDRAGVIRFRHLGQHAGDRAGDADLLAVLGGLRAAR